VLHYISMSSPVTFLSQLKVNCYYYPSYVKYAVHPYIDISGTRNLVYSYISKQLVIGNYPLQVS